ncbi:MAG TPA: NIL domain-containing protein [Allocoleopsis sp.]
MVSSQLSSNSDHRYTQTRIRIRIPKQYHHEPIISDLITRYELTVNIQAALLTPNAREDGWFDLELRGTIEQLRNAFVYLNDLSLEIWHDSDAHNESW